MNPTAVPWSVSRRSFLKRSAASVLGLGAAGGRLFAVPPEKPFDLLLTGGTVLDPYHQKKGAMSVGLKAGKIVQVAPKLDAAQADRVLDVTGLYVSPGW